MGWGGEMCLFCTTQSYVHNTRSRGRVPTKRSRGCARAALVQVETTTTNDDTRWKWVAVMRGGFSSLFAGGECSGFTWT